MKTYSKNMTNAFRRASRWLKRNGKKKWLRTVIGLFIGLFGWIFITVDISLNNTKVIAQRIQALGGLGLTAHFVYSSTPPLLVMSDKAALRHGVDPMLLRALVARESSWNPRAVSPKGAAGLTQLMPATAKHECGLLPEAIFEPARNLDCGARYFAKQLRRFKSVELALAAYNSGPARVARLGRVPRIRETQQYVSHIMADWNNKEAI